MELSIQNVPGEHTHYHLTPSCGLAKLCMCFGHPRFIPVKLNPTFTKAITDIVLQEIEEYTQHIQQREGMFKAQH